jgi:hypothetical protein
MTARAGDGIRTHDNNVGNVVLYQLSYTRMDSVNLCPMRFTKFSGVQRLREESIRRLKERDYRNPLDCRKCEPSICEKVPFQMPSSAVGIRSIGKVKALD